MINFTTGILNGCLYVFFFQVRQFIQNLLMA